MYSLDVESGQSFNGVHVNTKRTISYKCIVISVSVLAAVALLVGLLAGLLTRSSSSNDNEDQQLTGTYRAAAVQYMPYIHTRNASVLIPMNLAVYGQIVAEAASAGVDVLVFPEGGLGYLIADDTSSNATLSKLVMSPFCERVPAASERVIPCTMMNSTESPQLTTMSCLARQHNMTLMINMCQIEYCEPGESAAAFLTRSPHRFARSSCPEAGMYLWSSNVAFGSDGSVVAVYAKSNLFATKTISIPNSVPTSFVSSFGVRFGTFTSFDIEFASPQQSLLQSGVQHYLHPVWWGVNQAPQLTVTMIHQAWADRWGVNLIAANTLSKVAQGGGIYQAGEKRTMRYEPVATPVSGQYEILVQDLPKQMVRDEVPNEAPNKPYDSLPVLPDVTVEHSTPCSVSAVSMAGNCSFLQATTQQQSLQVQHGNVTCRAVIKPARTNNLSQLASYALFASRNLYTAPDTPSVLWMESCFLMRCTGEVRNGVQQCASSYASSAMFDNVRMLAGLSCSRFAATSADSGTGATPEGAVLPMLASNEADIENDSQYKYEYVGKFDGLCWWSIELSKPLEEPMFSMGFYAIDGQADPNIIQ